MNAFVRPARPVFVPIDEIDLSDALRPYNATVLTDLAQSIRSIGLQTPLTCIARDGKHILVVLRPYNATVLTDLAQSIRSIGLQTPLTCIARDGKHILVAGRNRLEALRTIGAEQAPVRIVDFSDVEAQLWQFSENLHRAELTKLEYDRQVVGYTELQKVKLAEETDNPISPQQEGQSEADKVRQVAAVSGGRGNTDGYREAARELNIPERTVRRAYQTASLAPEAQEAAVETGLDDNRSALLEAAKERTPEAQTATIRRLAERKTTPAEPTEGIESPKRAASVPPLRATLKTSAAASLPAGSRLRRPTIRRVWFGCSGWPPISWRTISK